MQRFWWPSMRTWLADYVSGCATCQQNKILTHRQRTPIYQIPTTENALPFQHVSLDLITQLPKSQGHDAVLTIVDHRCTRAAVFLPCSTTVTGPGIAQLYLDNMYRWFGLPSKLISDRDTLYLIFRKGARSKAGNYSEPVNGLSPSNRRTVRKEEPMGRTIPPSDHKRTTIGLG